MGSLLELQSSSIELIFSLCYQHGGNGSTTGRNRITIGRNRSTTEGNGTTTGGNTLSVIHGERNTTLYISPGYDRLNHCENTPAKCTLQAGTKKAKFLRYVLIVSINLEDTTHTGWDFWAKANPHTTCFVNLFYWYLHFRLSFSYLQMHFSNRYGKTQWDSQLIQVGYSSFWLQWQRT